MEPTEEATKSLQNWKNLKILCSKMDFEKEEEVP